MKLKKIKIQNFRQFYGCQELDLETDDQRNVIIIHGEYGVGKTTFIEAISWCLYGESGSNILNKKVFKDTLENRKNEVKVEVEFEHCKNEYKAIRSIHVIKIENKQYYENDGQIFELLINGKKSHQNSNDAIEIFLSKSLIQWFFVDGERIHLWSKPKNYKKIQTTITDLTGLSIYESNMKYLETIKNVLLKDQKKIVSQNRDFIITDIDKLEIEVLEKHIKLCQKKFDCMKDKYKFVKNCIRVEISNELSVVLQSIDSTYIAQITPEFKLKISRKINNYQETIINAGMGENQILAISFILILNMAAKWDQKCEWELQRKKGVYPLIFDSPFWGLDSKKRELISLHMQRLTSQVIVLLSESEWSHEVEQNFRPFLKYEYIFEHHYLDENDLNFKTLNINEKIHPLAVKDDFEYTSVIKVNDP